ncbi:uncharacterized protein LOC116222448 [Clupea harengus]|uniref:Uncharacterized protein LOC116222448 n=1 Tax=Clupea harengus TaxID=7950 RepID=A0A6P8G850_CLUHA|nr:uncharacterized protein LOC116222448 [Clupea harengus]
MNIGQTIISISTALLMYVISQLSAAPVTELCEGKVQLDGHCEFKLQPSITDLLTDPTCEVQVIIENTVRAIYEKGKVPANLSSPVLKATMHNFTLRNCPNSVTLDVDCPLRQKVRRKVDCHCVYSAPVQSINSTATPLTTVSKANITNSVAIGLGLVGVVAIALIIFKYRKEIVAFMKKNNTGTSKSCSTDGRGAVEMMLGHDAQA